LQTDTCMFGWHFTTGWCKNDVILYRCYPAFVLHWINFLFHSNSMTGSGLSTGKKFTTVNALCTPWGVHPQLLFGRGFLLVFHSNHSPQIYNFCTLDTRQTRRIATLLDATPYHREGGNNNLHYQWAAESTTEQLKIHLHYSGMFNVKTWTMLLSYLSAWVLQHVFAGRRWEVNLSSYHCFHCHHHHSQVISTKDVQTPQNVWDFSYITNNTIIISYCYCYITNILLNYHW